MTIEIVAFDAEYVVVRRATRWTTRGKAEPCGMALFRVADRQLAEQWSWSPTAPRAPGPGPRFVPPGAPRRLDGREEIQRLLTPPLRGAEDCGRRVTGYDPIVVYATEDPEVTVVEFDMHGEDAAGKAYRLPYVQIVRVHEGRSVVFRDYFDSSAMAGRPGSGG